MFFYVDMIWSNDCFYLCPHLLALWPQSIEVHILWQSLCMHDIYAFAKAHIFNI